ncbi:MAG: serine--tRNA ligase [Elusimicrobia bacterium CG03_land_8_20_14_0_80_50_18]|nr:MAG: serine--tRNA ligase [Elusimicrobia bacterium CG03_land_8_20_14_0_80_50_18]PIX14009.1 MAG: serine--tRNA ligase [Elusimicrobia bacterium CG_4_8_14_3_um_filter_50_9]
MIDVQLLRAEPALFKKRMGVRAKEEQLDKILLLDGQRRAVLRGVEELRARQKKVKSSEEGRGVKSERKESEDALKKLDGEFQALLDTLPNLPDEDVPGGYAENNRVIKTIGEPAKHDGPPHWEIIKLLDIVDFETASEISASFWPLLKGDGARLEMALINFFMAENDRAGFEPVMVPAMVSAHSAYGTGQLPKFEDDLYKVSEENLYLIPTGEVPAGNLFRNKIIDSAKLPLKIQIPSQCFRREAGSWGKLGKGLIRNHQFNKVEIFEFVKPESSGQTLDEMVERVSSLLQKLGLVHRVVLLAAGDMGFAAAKTYDIEVWMKGMGDWLEVSSCSNCRDFQSRRTLTRFKNDSGKTEFVHTLNGSALAVGRIFAALCENFWDGKAVILPDCLKQYMGKNSIG